MNVLFRRMNTTANIIYKIKFPYPRDIGEKEKDMKKISKKDSERILNHIKKARAILNSAYNEDEIQFPDIEKAENILSELSGIVFIANSTI